MINVDAVSVVSDEKTITPEDARAAGYASVKDLLADLIDPVDGAMLYRVELHQSSTPDPRSVLAEDRQLSETDIQALSRKLRRLDAARATPWTLSVLRAIQARPATRAGDLALDLGWPELLEFKLHVRRLKALGLTRSLRIGYELSPRGQAYLESLDG